MTLYASKSGKGFYDDAVHSPEQIPEDAVEITYEHWRELIAGQEDGMIIDFDGLRLVDHPIDTSPERHARDIAARRYAAEVSGIVVNGMPLPTDRDSQGLVTGAALAAVIDSNYRCQWKTANGFIDLNAQQIIALASAMRSHVQACFDREAALLNALAAGTYTDDQLDQGWPT